MRKKATYAVQLGVLFTCVYTVFSAVSLQAFSVTEWFADVAGAAIGRSQLLFPKDIAPLFERAIPASSPVQKTVITPQSSAAKLPAKIPKTPNSKLTKLPFHGYLPDIGPPAFRFAQVPPPFDRNTLVPVPLPMSAEEKAALAKGEEKPQETLHDMISAIIEEEFANQTTEEKPPADIAPDEATTVESTEPATTTPEVPEPATTTPQDPETPEDYTEFLNPDEIIYYFEEQIQNNESTNTSLGIPLSLPTESTPDVAPNPSRATFEQN